MIEVNWNPSERQLRYFAGIWFPAFFVVIQSFMYYRAAAFIPVWVWSLVILVSVSGLIRPSVARPVYLTWMWAAYPIGWTVSSLMMLSVFFLLITPVGFIMRLFGYDPMNRRFDRTVNSYWTPHQSGPDTSDYFRQF
jgi:Saxitoxin biosynthesis operon protein SxtJ